MKFQPGLALIAFALAALTGCGGSGSPVPVTGTITVKKKPEANLLIQFCSTAATGGKTFTGSATSAEEGKFEIVGADGKPGLPPGDYSVTVVDRNSEVEDEDLAKGKRIPPSRIEKKYMAPDEKVNPLKVKVEAGKTTYDLILD